jgi:hypothetical protein
VTERARPIDGAEGYALFLRHNGNVELDEINEYLRGLGLREVQPRMLLHYRKLLRHGYRGYVTQNRLDLAIAGESAWSEDVRAQYAELRRSVPGQLVDGAQVTAVQVERLGLMTATCKSQTVPKAGASVVLRLTTTGIERMARVVRSDPASGRFQLAFDAYTSLPLASDDAPYAVRLTFDLDGNTGSTAALTELMGALDHTLARLNQSDDEIPRVTRLSMQSPLEVELTGNDTIDAFVKLAAALLGIRQLYFTVRKTKAEAQGVELDNAQKRAAVQAEADATIAHEIETAAGLDDSAALQGLAGAGYELGEPNSITRRELFERAKWVLALPAQTAVAWIRRPAADSDNGAGE